MFGRSFGSVLDSLVERFPHEPALVDGDVRMDFTTLIGEIRAVGQALRALGARPGDRIGIAMEDSAELALAMYGGLWAGLTIVPLNIRLSVDNHVEMLADAGVKVLLYHAPTAGHVELVAARLDIDHVLALGDGGDLSLSGYSREAKAPTDVDTEAPVSIQYTGGTTGVPKGVVHSHRTLLTTLLGCALEFDIGFRERHAHVAPLTHSGYATMLPVWLRGGCNVILGGFDVDVLLDAIERERITSMIL